MRNRTLRLWLIAIGVATLMIVVRFSGLQRWLDQAQIQALVERAGPFGPVLFVGLFVASVVAQVPGLVFVFAAPALFRLPQAFLLCYLASNLAVTLNFALVRQLGGKPLGDVQSPRIQRLFMQLNQRPVRTVALLRALTVMFPPITSALALTSVRARHHALGSALGMILPITAILLGSHLLLSR